MNNDTAAFPPELVCPAVSTDVAAFMLKREEKRSYRKNASSRLGILLIRRGIPPFLGQWALPGGFLRAEETVEECALREIGEETGITPNALVPLGTYSRIDRDPRGRVISNAFLAVLSEDPGQQRSGFDASDAQWFEIEFSEEPEGIHLLKLSCGGTVLTARLEQTGSRLGKPAFRVLENEGLAFDHAQIIADAMTALRASARTPELVLELLPEKFTLSALQQVQETITNTTDAPANFRRKIAEYVEETEEYASGNGHRPAKIYTKRKK